MVSLFHIYCFLVMANLADMNGRVTLKCPQGELSGVQYAAHQVFLRIPYVQAERFQLPEPVNSWEGVLDASQKPEQPFQKVAPFVSGKTPESEDSLFLNIYTPKADNKKRAVMVWFYGGGFTQGSGYAALYNGKNLAEQCDVVVVTVNYRIGLLGYGYFEHLDDGELNVPPNLGLHDQLAALSWVQKSISDFGGDPDTVTVFGQSAGAMSINAMLACPQAEGLFKRAICQSGGDVLISSRSHVADVNNKALSKLGVQLDKLHELKTMHPKEMSKGPDGLLHLAYHTDLLPEKPLDVVLQGSGHKVDLMMGYTRHEVATPLIKKKLSLLVPVIEMFTDLKIQASYDEIPNMPLLAPKLKSNMDEVVAFYKSYYTKNKKKGSEAAICAAILTDAIFARPARTFLDAHSIHHENTYAYRFNWGLSILGTIPLSFHASDVPFPFNTLEALKPSLKVIAGVNQKTYALANNMMLAWANFAKFGDPNHDGLPAWGKYSKTQPGFMIFDEVSEFLDEERQEVFDFWDSFVGEFESSTIE
jgi:para-nitrobenzyl esterase